MARYTEKDKDKDKKAPAGTYAAPRKAPASGTYAAPPPAPAETYAAPKAAPSGYGQTGTLDALEAEDAGGSCSLEVVVSNEVTGEPVHKASVTLLTAGFRQTLKTNQKGVVCWAPLSPGEYEVEVASHHGYQPEPKQERVELTEGEDATLHIGLEPEKATLSVLAFYDAERCGDPEGQAPIKNLRFGVFDGSKLLGSGKTGDDGTDCLTFGNTGWVEVRPRGQVHAGGAHLAHAANERLLVLLEPGKQSEVLLAYVAGTASLTVEAVLTSDGCDEAPLPGVGLALYAKGANVPLRTAVTSDQCAIFDDLTPDTYVISITPPPAYQGSAVELDDPSQQGAAVVVHSDHHTQPLKLRFRRALCQVFGSILGAGSQFGWEGIRVALKSTDGKCVLRATTGAQGEFLFSNVPPGIHHLELADAKVFYNQDQWVLASGCQPRQMIHAKPGAYVTTQPFLLEQDKHTLTVRILDENDHPIAHTPFDVLAENGNLIGTFSTGPDGMRTIDVRQAGHYQVRWGQNDNLIYEADVNSEAFLEMRARKGIFSHRPGPPSGFGSETTIDIPYPLITESPSMGGGSWGSPAPPSSTDLGQTVQDALRSVLNWRSAGFNGDAKGFVAALNQSFTITQTQGHTEFTWTPRSYAAVQSGLGALTGAQASIYTRAKVALDQIMPLLKGLYPLLADADPQNVEAMRAIVGSGLNELVNEFGIEGGPRVLRVDDLFRQLTGFGNATTFNPNPEKVKGQFDQLATVFGLRRKQVNTIDEEQDLTNFLIIVDYTLGLQQSWLTQRPFFTRGSGSEPFLGTQLVLVERSLSVVTESVQEVYMAMDSVFVGKEERQVVELTFPPFTGDPGPSSLFVSELLGWIDQVASNEGPQLLKDGGKQGVISFQPTVQRLAFLAKNALLPLQTAPNLPKGYRTARVQNALAELADHLNETSNLIDQFPVSDSLGI
jgi:hypothetical protein